MCERCIHEKPNADAFVDMKSSPMSTDARTGYVLSAVAEKTTDSSSALDQWTASDLQLLLRDIPKMFDSLADVVTGFVPFIPRGVEDIGPELTLLRPAIVLGFL